MTNDAETTAGIWSTSDLQKLLIVVVDDHEAMRNALRRLLRSSGLQCQTYSSGVAFLEGAYVRQPDCLLLDWHMPGLGGSEVIQHLKTGAVSFPIIVISGEEDPAISEIALSVGASAFFRKPVEHEELMLGIMEAIKNRSGRPSAVSG